jgi:hypothetical protein
MGGGQNLAMPPPEHAHLATDRFFGGPHAGTFFSRDSLSMLTSTAVDNWPPLGGKYDQE